MTRLAILEMAMLAMEKQHQPFHVGALNLFRPPVGSGPDFAARLSERLNQSTEVEPPFNRRVSTRLGISRWEPDPNFDLTHHFVHLALPRPGSIRDLLAMVSRVHSAHLDRAYPLWRTYLIEGLADGRLATYSKIHHALVDGVAGVRLMLRSMSPDREESAGMPPPWALRRTTAKPDSSRAASNPRTSMLSDGVKLISPILRELSNTWRDHRAGHPDLVTTFQAPRCILNVPISASRRFAAQSYSTAGMRVIAERFGATLNDVVLALCATALRRYLLDLGALPNEPLIAAVPMVVGGSNREVGNAFTCAFANLATHLTDPVERLNVIKRSMDYSKARMRHLSQAQVMAYSAAVVAPGALLTMTGLDRRHAMVNVVISHIPGPRRPLYWQGCELDGIYPASLLLDGCALNITLVSRRDTVDFGFLACRRTLPSMQKLLGYVEDSLAELQRLV